YAYRLSERIGLDRVVVLMPVVLLTALAGLSLWDSLGALIFLPLSAMVMSATFPIFGSYIHHRVPSSRRATVMSLYQLLFSLLLMLLEPGLGFVSDNAGLPAAYRVAGIFLAVT